MNNVHLTREKSMIEHRSSNILHRVENVAHAQPSVSHEEDEIQNSNFEHGSNKRPAEESEEDDRKPAAKRIKKEPEDEAQSWAQDEQIEEPTPKPWEDKKDYEAAATTVGMKRGHKDVDDDDNGIGITKWRMIQYDHDHVRRYIQQDYLGPSPIFNHCKFQQIFHITQGVYNCIKAEIKDHTFYNW